MCLTHTPTTDIYTLSLHDALPICNELYPLAERMDRDEWWPDEAFRKIGDSGFFGATISPDFGGAGMDPLSDRKSTRLNSSHSSISYAVFCLKKKNKIELSFTITLN